MSALRRAGTALRSVYRLLCEPQPLAVLRGHATHEMLLHPRRQGGDGATSSRASLVQPPGGVAGSGCRTRAERRHRKLGTRARRVLAADHVTAAGPVAAADLELWQDRANLEPRPDRRAE